MMQSRLGHNSRTVDQALTSEGEHEHALSRTTSLDRRAVEGALVTEGVHRPITPIMKNSMPLVDRMDSAIMLDGSPKHDKEASHDQGHRLHLNGSPTPPISTEPHTKFSGEAPGERGHAHDPMEEEPLFLGIGTGGHNDDSSAASIAESPTAADFSIYDTAYQKEVERIREAQGHKATVYLTRRVDTKKEYRQDDNMVELPREDDVKGQPHEGFMNLVEKVRSQGKTRDSLIDDDESQEEENETKTQDEEDTEKWEKKKSTDSDSRQPPIPNDPTKAPTLSDLKSRSKKISELVDRAQEGLRKRGKEGSGMVGGLMSKVVGSSFGRKASE